MPDPLDPRWIEMETKIAFLERGLDEATTVVRDLTNEIDGIRRHLQRIQDRLEGRDDDTFSTSPAPE